MSTKHQDKGDVIQSLADDVEHWQQRAIDGEKELEAVKQAYWNTRAKLGFDNDGDPTPKAMTFPTFDQLILMDAAELLGERIERDGELTTIQAAKQQAEQRAVKCDDQISGLIARVNDAEQKVRALEQYATHLETCATITCLEVKPCDCGFDELEAQIQSATADKEGDGKG